MQFTLVPLARNGLRTARGAGVALALSFAGLPALADFPGERWIVDLITVRAADGVALSPEQITVLNSGLREASETYFYGDRRARITATIRSVQGTGTELSGIADVRITDALTGAELARRPRLAFSTVGGAGGNGLADVALGWMDTLDCEGAACGTAVVRAPAPQPVQTATAPAPQPAPVAAAEPEPAAAPGVIAADPAPAALAEAAPVPIVVAPSVTEPRLPDGVDQRRAPPPGGTVSPDIPAGSVAAPALAALAEPSAAANAPARLPAATVPAASPASPDRGPSVTAPISEPALATGRVPGQPGVPSRAVGGVAEAAPAITTPQPAPVSEPASGLLAVPVTPQRRPAQGDIPAPDGAVAAVAPGIAVPSSVATPRAPGTPSAAPSLSPGGGAIGAPQIALADPGTAEAPATAGVTSAPAPAADAEPVVRTPSAPASVADTGRVEAPVAGRAPAAPPPGGGLPAPTLPTQPVQEAEPAAESDPVLAAIAPAAEPEPEIQPGIAGVLPVPSATADPVAEPAGGPSLAALPGAVEEPLPQNPAAALPGIAEPSDAVPALALTTPPAAEVPVGGTVSVFETPPAPAEAATEPAADPVQTLPVPQIARDPEPAAPAQDTKVETRVAAVDPTDEGPTLANAQWVGFTPAVYSGASDGRAGAWIVGPFDRKERTGWITDTATGATTRVKFIWRDGSSGLRATLSRDAAAALGLGQGDVANLAVYLPR